MTFFFFITFVKQAPNITIGSLFNTLGLSD